MITKRIVLEGTQEQIDNLKLAMEHVSMNLPKIREDYQTSNLWSINDVKSNYKGTDEEAMDVLVEALDNDATIAQIWYAIDFHAIEDNLKPLNDD